MNALVTVDQIDKIIRDALIRQSMLKSERVRNSLSLHGEALEKWLVNQEYNSLGMHTQGYDYSIWDDSIWDELANRWSNSDAMMLFELQSRQNTSDMSENEDDHISYYRSYRIYVMIYGTYGNDIANLTVARFRTQANRLELREKGIYLETVSNPTQFNEYKNETMWTRNDFEIDITCKMIVSPVSYDEPFETLNDISMKEAN